MIDQIKNEYVNNFVCFSFLYLQFLGILSLYLRKLLEEKRVKLSTH